MTDNILYMAIGAPGSGKSTWWEKGIANGTIPSDQVCRINMDSIRKNLTGNEADQSKNGLVASIANADLKNALSQGVSVIYWDNSSAKAYYRREVINLAKAGNYKVVGILFDLPIAEIKRRNAGRDRKVPENVIDNMYDNIKKNPPVIAEGFDQIIVVSN